MNKKSYLNKLTDISTVELTKYLESKGWSGNPTIISKAIVWHRLEDKNLEFEVVQPIERSVKGFSQKLEEAIEAIADFEQRDSEHVLDDIFNYSSDLIKIRVIHDDVNGGSIPLDDGVLLIEKSKDLLVASTLSTFSKKKHFSGGRSVDVQKFIANLRLGQTEEGSFIVNLISPITSKTESQKDLYEGSLTRSVVNNLAKSLSAITDAIEMYSNDNNFSHFEDAISKGVSANLCDALIGLSGSSKTRDFEIKLILSGVESDEQKIETRHSFKPTQLPAIEKASEYFKGNYVINNYTALGLVNQMKHSTGEDFGEIIVESLVYDSDKNIKVQLDLDNYWQAVRAHESKSYVSCKGNLIVTPKSATLSDSFDFRVTENEKLF